MIRTLFAEAPSKMLKDGGILRDAIDAIQDIQFDSAEDIHTLSHLYESMLAKLGREGGMGGEFYTPRPIIEFIVNMIGPKPGQTIYDPAMGSAGFLVEATNISVRGLATAFCLATKPGCKTKPFSVRRKSRCRICSAA